MYIHLICYSLHSLQIIGAQGQDYSRQSDSEEVASLRSDVHPSLEQDLTPPLKTRLKVTSDFTLSLPRPHSCTQMHLGAYVPVQVSDWRGKRRALYSA